MYQLRQPISASDLLRDFYVISMEFLSLSDRLSFAQNVPSSEERGEMAFFAGYHAHSSRRKFEAGESKI